MGLTVDEKIRFRLHVLAVTAAAFAEAHNRADPAYDWITQEESQALANLRAQIAELAREEAKRRRGVAA